MRLFTYIAFDNEGRKITGAQRMASSEKLRSSLEDKGFSNVQIFTSKTIYKAGAYAIATPKELSIFCRQMSVLFFSQITLMEGLTLLAAQTDNKQLKLALEEIYEHMNEGHAFGESIGLYPHIFGSYLLNMITIGETSGTLDSVFADMSVYFEKESKTRKRIKAAVTYPLILTILMAAIVLLLILKILPMFQSTLTTMGGTVPASTRVIFAVGNFIGDRFLIIITALAALIGAFVFYIRTEKGRVWLDKMKITLPFLRFINTRVITTRFSRSLAMLLGSGVQLLNAMEEIIILIDNKHLEGKFQKAFLRVKEGENLAEVLAEVKIFPPLFIRMVTIGDSTGHLDEMLDKSAGVFDEEVDEAVERVTMMVEPALIIVLSVVVGVILLSVMLPMISIMNSIG